MREGEQKTERIVDTVRMKGELYYRFDTLSYQPNVLLRESGPQVYRFIDTSEVLWYNFSADSGATWKIPTLGYMTVEDTSDTADVPASNFSGCRRFLWNPGPDAGSTDWVARGTGIVRRVLNTIAGPRPWYLSSALITSVDSRSDQQEMASRFIPEQNYPNPFNPLTIIQYTVGGTRGQGPGISKIRLVVYDLLGKEVRILVDEQKQPGNYEVSFDGSVLASGVYFYRLTAGSFAQSHKMFLVK